MLTGLSQGDKFQRFTKFDKLIVQKPMLDHKMRTVITAIQSLKHYSTVVYEHKWTLKYQLRVCMVD